MQEPEYYEAEFGIYTDSMQKDHTLCVIVEFEEDSEYGLLANYYVSAADTDREFFDHSVMKQKDAPKLSRKEWIERCLNLADEQVGSGEIDFAAIKKWLEHQCEGIRKHEAKLAEANADQR